MKAHRAGANKNLETLWPWAHLRAASVKAEPSVDTNFHEILHHEASQQQAGKELTCQASAA
jgi:hypothetical protein